MLSAVDVFYPSLVLLACILFMQPRRPNRYPPGPPSWPILGAALIHPKTEFWRTYAEWGRQYGAETLISFHILGRRLVILNSAADAMNLLSKRSAIYSDRPLPMMSGVLMQREKSIFYISDNNRFKKYRRMMHHSFNPNASKMYWDVQEHEARLLIDSIIKSPGHLAEHIRRNAAAVIMKIGYGYPVTRNDDRFVALAEETMRVGSLAAAPGKWLVDSLPVLRFIPEWFPGAGFKRQAKKWSHQLYTHSLEPYVWAKKNIASGMAVPSFISMLLQPSDGSLVDPDAEDHILWTAGALYTAGADTSVSAIKSFFFAMMMFPAVQKTAQGEVDKFFASENRIPTMSDQAAFPYVASVLKEVLRWAPASPIAKTTIIANIWAMMHDESVYPNPSSFDPTRFLGACPQADPREIVFGFGRRTCPGQSLAENSIWIQMVLSLLIVNISKAVDASGNPIEPEISFTTAVVSHIKPFQYQITPRSNGAYSLIQETLQDSA